VWNGCSWLRTSEGSCEHSNDPSDSVKGGELFDKVSDH
jgi:hypothetical protein